MTRPERETLDYWLEEIGICQLSDCADSDDSWAARMLEATHGRDDYCVIHPDYGVVAIVRTKKLALHIRLTLVNDELNHQPLIKG